MDASTNTFLGSTIGRKIVMAATGMILFGFVVGHMENLQIYLGATALNHYAVFLREFLHGAGLWIARGVLLASVILHVWAAVSLTRLDRAARGPVAYREWQARDSTYASRTMRWTGALLAAFIVYHLLDFTLGTVNPGYEEGNVYANVVRSFSVVPVAIMYVLAMGLLALHLKHGTLSMLRTLGMSHPRHQEIAAQALNVIVGLTIAANISFPIAVLLGWVR